MILGFDTSCYTTSWAMVNSNNKLISEGRRILNVKKGERGLSQSTALFQHVKNGYPLVVEALKSIDPKNIKAVIASTKPRPVNNSYMPVFIIGKQWGELIASTCNVPFFATTHQEGHLKAAMWGAKAKLNEKFLAVHFSGGTSEILLVKNKNFGFDIKIIVSSTDLAAGQFLDRIGVNMGLDFPAGIQLEKLANNSTDKDIILPVAITKSSDFSFSGPENAAKLLLEKKVAPEDIAMSVLDCIANTLIKSLNIAIEKTKLNNILFAGGVMANKIIRKKLLMALPHAKLYFSPPKYATDNAVGVAFLGAEKLIR